MNYFRFITSRPGLFLLRSFPPFPMPFILTCTLITDMCRIINMPSITRWLTQIFIALAEELILQLTITLFCVLNIQLINLERRDFLFTFLPLFRLKIQVVRLKSRAE